jgi:hypothetical protein
MATVMVVGLRVRLEVGVMRSFKEGKANSDTLVLLKGVREMGVVTELGQVRRCIWLVVTVVV